MESESSEVIVRGAGSASSNPIVINERKSDEISMDIEKTADNPVDHSNSKTDSADHNDSTSDSVALQSPETSKEANSGQVRTSKSTKLVKKICEKNKKHAKEIYNWEEHWCMMNCNKYHVQIEEEMFEALGWFSTHFKVIHKKEEVGGKQYESKRPNEIFSKYLAYRGEPSNLKKEFFTHYYLRNTDCSQCQKDECKTVVALAPELENLDMQLPELCTAYHDGNTLVVKLPTSHIVNGNVLVYTIFWAEDKTSVRFRNRCVTLLKQKPPEHWVILTQSTLDGVLGLCSKVQPCTGVMSSRPIDLEINSAIVEAIQNSTKPIDISCRTRWETCLETTQSVFIPQETLQEWKNNPRREIAPFCYNCFKNHRELNVVRTRAHNKLKKEEGKEDKESLQDDDDDDSDAEEEGDSDENDGDTDSGSDDS